MKSDLYEFIPCIIELSIIFCETNQQMNANLEKSRSKVRIEILEKVWNLDLDRISGRVSTLNTGFFHIGSVWLWRLLGRRLRVCVQRPLLH